MPTDASVDKGGALEQMRLDLWLWRARFFKTRSLAGGLLDKGGARVERAGQVRKVTKRSVQVAPGDLVSFRYSGKVETVEILALPHRRGPAAEAQLAYKRLADKGGEEA